MNLWESSNLVGKKNKGLMLYEKERNRLEIINFYVSL